MTTTVEKLDSLAGVKRACRVGAKLRIVATDTPHLQLTMTEGRERPIVRRQGNAIVVCGVHKNGGREYDPNERGWLYWPKASELEFHGDDTFTIKGLARYRVIPA